MDSSKDREPMDEGIGRPWWLSSETGGTGEDENAGSKSDTGGAGTSWDVTSMLGMVSSLAGQWWASSGASEHATHEDPANHPDCVVCKGLLVLGSATRTPDLDVLPAVRWLPIRRA
jgi:hypothetical protein